MSTYTQILYHIVFGTKDRQPVLAGDRRDDLFRYTWGITKRLECPLFRVNGVEDHLHLLVAIHPTVALADFVKTIKTSTSKWIKEGRVFPRFRNWQEGYGAFTHCRHEKEALIEYIKNQQEHHRTKSFLEEYKELLLAAGIEFDERYLG